jgi:hypothetical protein
MPVTAARCGGLRGGRRCRRSVTAGGQSPRPGAPGPSGHPARLAPGPRRGRSRSGIHTGPRRPTWIEAEGAHAPPHGERGSISAVPGSRKSPLPRGRTGESGCASPRPDYPAAGPGGQHTVVIQRVHAISRRDSITVTSPGRIRHAADASGTRSHPRTALKGHRCRRHPRFKARLPVSGDGGIARVNRPLVLQPFRQAVPGTVTRPIRAARLLGGARLPILHSQKKRYFRELRLFSQ